MFGPLLEVEMLKNCTPLWREAHFQVKMVKTPDVRTTFGRSDVEKLHAVVARSSFPSQKGKKKWRSRTTFGSWDVEKAHGVVARSTVPSQNVKNTTCSDHFLEVEMSKKCTSLWRVAHFQVKSVKDGGVGTTLEVQMSFRAAGAKDCAPRQKWAKRESVLAVSTTTTATIHYTTLHYIILRCATLHYTTPLQTPLHYITSHYTPLHYATPHYTTLHYTLHYTTLHYTSYSTVHYTSCSTLHYNTFHYATLNYNCNYEDKYKYSYTTLHYTILHKLHYTTLHSTTRHYTPLHFTTLQLQQQHQLQPS